MNRRVDIIHRPNLASAAVLQSDYDYFAWDTPNGQGRLKQIKSGTPATPNSLLELRYYSGTNTPAYNALGNLLNIYDYKTGNPQTQAFSYDAMDRLVSASADGMAGNYSENYTYDPTSGNLASKAGVEYTYAAQVSNCQGTPSTHTIAHAVSTVGSNTYAYDCNGNQTQRVVGGITTTLVYDAENRLVSVSGSTSAAFVYDGDGKRVKGTVNGVTTTYIGDYAEWDNSTSTLKKYYTASGTRIALREGAADPLWLLGDHLGSTSQAANFAGTAYPNGKQLYKPWGEKRYPDGASGLPTTYRYTGQREESAISLYWYGSRWYDSKLGRFVQPDTIIPEAAQGVQAWDRYAYANNSPVVYNDPSGQCIFGIDTIVCVALAGAAIGAAVGYGAQVYNNNRNGSSKPWTENISAEPIVGGAILGTGAVLVAPAAVAAAGDVLVGAGVATGSTALFGAGMSTYGASSSLGGFLYGKSVISHIPDYIGTESGELIPVPSGATGPIPARNGAGFQYTGGSGSNGLDPRVTDVRIMDPTLPKPPSPGYPNGYVSYSNAGGQTVNPYTGRTVNPSDPWWHIELK